MGVLFPKMREAAFMSAQQPEALLTPGYYLFAAPLYLSVGLAAVPFVSIFRSQPDHAERIRVQALLMATPFLMSGIIHPQWKTVATAIGEMIFLAGAVRYHVLQGQRAQFMGRFLAPEVGRLVRERGLAVATQQSRVELSVVACDLRGFTAFSDSAAPEETMQLLRDYYAAIGDVVTRYGGTIESVAGDGIMVLVGAPLSHPDHARRAVGMAREILDRAAQLATPRRVGGEVGIGVGVASGYVTVGVIGGEARFEYVAVGPALNLAARLCDRAQSGQVLTEPRIVALLGDESRHTGHLYRLERLEAAELKGFARPVMVFAVSTTD
jgi:class 3 adenylate cyclase